MDDSGVLHTGEAIASALDVPHGAVALVGGGGKTTLMLALSDALKSRGTVIVTTTTHIWPPSDMPVLLDPTAGEVRAALVRTPRIAVGHRQADGKLTACAIPIEILCRLADYVLIEADGAKGKPLKAPAAHEPVIPACTDMVVAVAGLDGIGRSIADAAFRAELYAGLLGTDTAHVVTPLDAAMVLMSRAGQHKDVPASARYCVALNKADDERRVQLAKELAAERCMQSAERILITRLKEETQPC